MKNKTPFSQTFALLLLSCLFALPLLTSCNGKNVEQNTEGEEYENIYDDKNYVRTGLGDILGVPKGIYVSLDVGKSGLDEILIDDKEIEVADTDELYVKYFTVASLDSAGKKEILEAIFDESEGIYVYDSSNRVRREIQRDIDFYEQIIKSLAETGDSETISYYESQIEVLQASLENAPNSYAETTEFNEDAFLGTIGDCQYVLRAYSGGSGDNEGWIGVSYLMSLNTSYLYVRPYVGNGVVAATTSVGLYDEEDGINQSSMSRDEATEIAEEFLLKFGIDEVEVSTISDLVWCYVGADSSVVDCEVDGYVIEFCRTINNVPIYQGSIELADNMQQDAGSITMPAETFKITIYNGAVIGAYIFQVVDEFYSYESVESALSFDEVIDALNENVADYYRTYPTAYNKVTFTDVRMTYMAVAADDGNCKYIPVWIFMDYDDEVNETKYGYVVDNSLYPEQFVAVNAVTGDVIDVVNEAKDMGVYVSE